MKAPKAKPETIKLTPPLKAHPLADLLPEISGIEFESLKADIETNGLAEQIIVYDGKILDGRSRYTVLQALGRERRPEYFVTFEAYSRERGLATTPLALVRSLNVERRHLNESQRSMFAAAMGRMAVGRPKKSGPEGHIMSQPERAEFVGVSKRTVQRAETVTDKGVPELIDLVKSGQLKVKDAEAIARLSPAEQRREIEKGVAKLPTAAKRVARDKRAAELAAVQLEKPEGKFGVILCDAPWHFEPYDEDTGLERAAENHYPTMSLADISRLPVADWCEDDCVLFFWATIPMLIEAVCVLIDWGFVDLASYMDGEGKDRIPLTRPDKSRARYVSQAVWVKDRIDRGYWFRGKHEILLVCTRGHPVAPAPGQQSHSVIEAKYRGPSVKPDSVHEMIDQLWPDARKLEMFARQKRKGWTIWGKEAPTK